MPQKRNPVGASIAIAASVRVPGLVSTMLIASVQEHERGLGNWPAEWETLPEIVMLAAGALAAMLDVAQGLDVDAERMRGNLGLTNGLIFAESAQIALAPTIGRDAAHALVARACRRALSENAHLRDILASEPEVVQHLGSERIDALFDPGRCLGESSALIERALARHPRQAH
jgi:3-carboxy-cis,cis-muconate cycloisomerase